MSKSTRATLALNKAGVNFTLHRYDYDPDAERMNFKLLPPSAQSLDAS